MPKAGAPRGIRTPDLLLRRQSLGRSPGSPIRTERVPTQSVARLIAILDATARRSDSYFGGAERGGRGPHTPFLRAAWMGSAGCRQGLDRGVTRPPAHPAGILARHPPSGLVGLRPCQGAGGRVRV